jgi:hypothetical protein
MLVQGKCDLFEVVLALDSPRCLTRSLHRGEQYCDQDSDDRDDHQEFDEREAARPPVCS